MPRRRRLPPNPRVVTQQKASPRFFATVPAVTSPRGILLASASYCGDACRAAMHRARDRERKWLRRNTKRADSSAAWNTRPPNQALLP